MIDAAQNAGVVFDSMDRTFPDFALKTELNALCEKAIGMGRAARSGQSSPGFTTPEILMLAEKYIHCSANWNSVVRDGQRSGKTGEAGDVH